MNERISFYHAYACRADKCDRHPALSPTLLGDTCFCSTQSGMALPAIQNVEKRDERCHPVHGMRG